MARSMTLDGRGPFRALCILTGIAALSLACLHYGEPGIGDLGWQLTATDAALAAAALVVLLTTNVLAGRFFGNPDESGAGRISGGKLLVFLFIGFAALAEELAFRGVLQNRYGLVAASFAFGLAHANASPTYFVLSVVTGFVLGGVYKVTGSFPAVVVAHAVHNWIVYFLPEDERNETTADVRGAAAGDPGGGLRGAGRPAPEREGSGLVPQ